MVNLLSGKREIEEEEEQYLGGQRLCRNVAMTLTSVRFLYYVTRPINDPGIRSNLIVRDPVTCDLNPTIMADASMSPPEAPAGTPPPAPSGPAPTSGSPNEFLKAVVGKRVVVRLLSGVDYKGGLRIV
jgi:hypothetical protein